MFFRTFAPFWQVIKSATERLATTHQKLVQKLNEVVKELQKYGEGQTKKHKQVSCYWSARLKVNQVKGCILITTHQKLVQKLNEVVKELKEYGEKDKPKNTISKLLLVSEDRGPDILFVLHIKIHKNT